MFHRRITTLFPMFWEDACNDDWDMCECGATHFEANEKEGERVCTSCGVVSAIEFFQPTEKIIPYYYKHASYFQNTIIANALSKGAPITNIQDHLMAMFHKSLTLFFRSRQVTRRDNYPNYQYALWKLCGHLNVDVKPYIKLPKMRKTLEAVEKDWLLIDPCFND